AHLLVGEMMEAATQQDAVRIRLPEDAVTEVAARLIAQQGLCRIVTFPVHADVAADAHGVEQADAGPDRPAATEPQRSADLLANQSGHPHPDLDARQPCHVPARLARAVLAAEIHEVGFEVTAAPIARPGAKNLA